MQGRVDNVETRQVNTKYGLKTAYTYTINGDKYGSMKDYFLSEGDAVEFDFVSNGAYKNISFATKIDAGTLPTTSAPSTAGGTAVNNFDTKQKLIVRQSSLKEAINTIALRKAKPSDKNLVDEIVALAELFTEYVYNGTDNVITGEEEDPLGDM